MNEEWCTHTDVMNDLVDTWTEYLYEALSVLQKHRQDMETKVRNLPCGPSADNLDRLAEFTGALLDDYTAFMSPAIEEAKVSFKEAFEKLG